MSKKKDPNIILRDKRLRALVRRKKNAVKETEGFGCPFLDRMVEEDYEIMERVIRLEHFVWNVVVEEKQDEKTGEAHKELTFGEFTAAANALDKRDRDLLVRQRRHMGAYQATLEQRMERICKRLSEQKGKRAGDVRDSMEKRDEDYRRHHAEEPGSENPVEVVFIL